MQVQSCQNSEQNTTLNIATVLKNHRGSLGIACKVIAFQEIAKADSSKSARDISKLLNVPNSSMQTWREKESLTDTYEDKISEFVSTIEGQMFIDRIVKASMFNNKCGSSGILGVQQFLRHSGLHKWIASSTGTLQVFWERVETSIIVFGDEQEKELAQKMKTRKISVTLDEMFRHGDPCLVAIATVSNYILFSKFTENRKAETWKKELKQNITEKFSVTIGQVQSDLCGTIRSVTESEGAIHSPDTFHGMYEFSKATSAAMSSQEKSTETALSKIEEAIKKQEAQPIRIDSIEKEKKKEKMIELKKKSNDLTLIHEERKNRGEETQKARKELGQIYHPINLKTGKIQSTTVVKKKIEEQIDTIKANAEDAGLANSSLEKIEKGRRAFHLMEEYLKKFFIFFIALMKNAKLSLEQRVFFKEVVFPLSYFKMIVRRLPKKEREQLKLLILGLEKKFEVSLLQEEIKKMLMELGKEAAENFQRSSSCVEGRNGNLSLLLHRFHRLSERTLRALNIVHNFTVRRRDSSRSTAAERFFEAVHDDLFEYLVEHVRSPGRPQVHIRKKLTEIAA